MIACESRGAKMPKATERKMTDLHNPKVLLKDFNREQWECYVRRMELCIGRRDFSAAHKALDEFLANTTKEAITPDSSIWMLSGSVPYRVLVSLESHGYQTVRAVAGAKDSDLEKIYMISAVTIARLREAIETSQLSVRSCS